MAERDRLFMTESQQERFDNLLSYLQKAKATTDKIAYSCGYDGVYAKEQHFYRSLSAHLHEIDVAVQAERERHYNKDKTK